MVLGWEAIHQDRRGPGCLRKSLWPPGPWGGLRTRLALPRQQRRHLHVPAAILGSYGNRADRQACVGFRSSKTVPVTRRRPCCCSVAECCVSP